MGVPIRKSFLTQGRYLMGIPQFFHVSEICLFPMFEVDIMVLSLLGSPSFPIFKVGAWRFLILGNVSFP